MRSEAYVEGDVSGTRGWWGNVEGGGAESGAEVNEEIGDSDDIHDAATIEIISRSNGRAPRT